jgi:hypothetical protein
MLTLGGFMKILTLITGLLFTFLILTMGCRSNSSSGTSSGTSSSTSSSTLTVSGVAAAGSPIVGQAWLKDYEGNFSTDSPTTIDGDGNFSFDVTGMQRPFFLQVKGNVAGNYYELYSVTFNPGRANINPLSHLAIAASGEKGPAAIFDAPEQSGITEQSLETAIEEIQRMLQPLLELNNVENSDPIRDSFVADHSGLDAVLDAIDINLDDNLNATISNKLTGETLIQAAADDLISAVKMDFQDANQANESKTDLSEIIEFIEDYWLTQSRSAKTNYFADDYLHAGYNKALVLTNYPDWKDTTDLVTLRHFTLTDKTDDDIYSLYYESVLTDGTIKQNTTFVKKTNGQWFFCGSGSLYSVSSRSRGVKRTHVDNSIEYCAGIDFNINDYAAQGIEMVTVDGPGLPETIKFVARQSGTILDIITSQRTDGCVKRKLYNMSDETILNELTDTNIEYTLKAYGDYNSSTYAPVGAVLETRNITVSKRPLTRAELTADGADYFASFTNLETHDIASFGLGDTIEHQYRLPEGFVIYRGWITLWFGDDDDHEGEFETDLELDNDRATLVTSSPSWTPAYANLAMFIHDGFGRMYKTTRDFE